MGDILLGTSGWSYEEWVGSFYESSKESKLGYYSKVFKTAEIDSTFYAYPSRGLVWGWLKATPPGFTFTAKVPQLITHEKMLDLKEGVEQDLVRFCDLMEPLRNARKLGCLLIQLPPRFAIDISTLEDFLKVLPQDFEYAVEFRHLSWMKNETWKLLEDYKVAYTIVDEPLLPPEIHITSDFAYIRWHGRGKRPWFDYLYSSEELKPWIPKVEETSSSTSKVYGYFNNHFHGYAVENCLQVLEILGKLSPEQAEAKKVVDDYRRNRSTPRVGRDLLSFIGPEAVSETKTKELLRDFMGVGRLRRAQDIKDDEVTMKESTEKCILASIRDYNVLMDLEKRLILHDCADWSRCIPMKQFCKHLGKIFLILPESKAAEILSSICSRRDEWEFKQYPT